MSFKLEDIKLEENVSKQEIKGEYEIHNRNYLTGDRTFCFFHTECNCEGDDVPECICDSEEHGRTVNEGRDENGKSRKGCSCQYVFECKDIYDTGCSSYCRLDYDV